MKGKEWVGPVGVFVVVLLLDQISKITAQFMLVPVQSITVIPNFFDLTLIYNPGAAFGLFARLDDGWRRMLLGGITIVALVVIGRMLLRDAKDDPLSRFALAGILGGAVGNLIDRIRFDSVIDFLDFYVGQHHWPAFNIADSAISIGVAILIYRWGLFREKHTA